MESRRLYPRMWHTDWLTLKGISAVIGGYIAEVVRAGDRVLDFGCGDMPYKPLIEQRLAHYSGADFGDQANLEIGADGKIPVADATFDLILSIQVLEHVRDLDTYFNEICRVLRPDGRLILSTHGSWLYHPHPEDHWRWTRTGLELVIQRHGFDIERMTPVVGPLATTTMVRLTGFSFFLKRIPLFGNLISAFLAVIMNLRAVLEDAVTPTQFKADNGCVYVALCKLTKP